MMEKRAPETKRAHSVVRIKRIDDAARTISGIASTVTPDRMLDVVEPDGAEYVLPVPLLMGHDHDAPIGNVTAIRGTGTGLTIKAQLAPAGVSERIDEAWRMVKSGVLRGLSIGFRPLESEPLKTGGRRFKRWELMELSVVAVPANREASITEIKALDSAGEPDPVRVSNWPSYPKHLSPDERQAVMEYHARNHVDGMAEAKGFKLTGATRDELVAKAIETLVHRWTAERLTELEAKVARLTNAD